MTKDHRNLIESETTLKQLREDLNALSGKISAEPKNTSLVIRRVNLMGRILSTQAAVDRMRSSLAQA